MKNGTQKVLEKVDVPDIRFVSREDGISVTDIRRELSQKNYDPETWPLFDMCLVQEETQDVLCFSIDMLVADFTSITIMLNEMELIYNGVEPKQLPDVTFRDVIVEKANRKDETGVEKAKEYWLNRMDSLPSAPELPILSAAPQTTSVSQKNTILSYGEWEKIEAYAKENKLTATSIVLNVYADVLSRWSADSHFTINVTMADRRNPKAA